MFSSPFNYLTKSNIIAISDLEGFDINSSIPINCQCNNEKCPSCSKQIYICGDLLDSTYTDPSKLESKSYNLRNIQKVLKNKNNIKLFLGNRDINKVKLVKLGKLKSNDSNLTNIMNMKYNSLLSKFNDGTLNFNNYNIYKEVKFEWEEKMVNWAKFWAKAPASIKSDTFSNQPFYDRYFDIFSDSMGAPNLLNTIPKELGLTITNDDEKAFIVLLVFNSMLSNNLRINLSENIDGIIQKTNASFCNGWLFKLLLTSSVCGIKEYNKKKYIFSHGGISKTLYNKFGDIEFIEKRSESEDTFKLKGGGLYKIEYIIDKLNKKFNDHLKLALNCNRNNINFILGMSADFDFNTNGQVTSTLMSPIMPGFPQLVEKEDHFFEDGFTIIQVFGHKPLGYGASIFRFEQNYNGNINATILVNLDASVSFKNGQFNSITGKDHSNSYLEIDFNGLGTVHTQISLIDTIKFNKYTTLIFTDYIPTKDTPNVISNDDMQNNINIVQHIDNVKQTDYGKIGNKIRAFHGISVDHKYIFSVVQGWFVTLFVLNEDNYKRFIGQTQATGSYKEKYLKYKAKYLALKNNI